MNSKVSQQLQKKVKSKKGFTLIELIVVIVILAILMAISLPSLTGYIDQAREIQVMADAKTAATALQAVVTKAYAYTDGDPIYGTMDITHKVRVGRYTGSNYANTGKTYLETINELTGKNYKAENFRTTPTADRITFDKQGGTSQLKSFVYVSDDGKIVLKYTAENGFQRHK